MIEETYTVKEIARKLRLSRASVYRLVQAGRLGCHRPGAGARKIMIPQRDLDCYLATCRGEVKRQPAEGGGGGGREKPGKRTYRELGL